MRIVNKNRKLETEISGVEADMATPEGASDMALYEKHQKLKRTWIRR